MREPLFQRASPGVLAALLTLAGSAAAPGLARAQATDIDTAQPSYLASDLGGAVNPVFRGGVLKTDQGGATYAQGFTLDGSGTNAIDLAGATPTFSGTFSDASGGTPGDLTIRDSVGGGKLTLSGTSSYTGATTIAAGTLSLTGKIETSSGVALTGSNAVFDVSNLVASAEIKGLSGVSGSQVRLGAKGLTVNQASATTFAGQITGSGTSGFVKSGVGVLTLSGDNTYSSLTTISAGTLALSGSGSIAGSSGVVDNATFDISGTMAGASVTTLSGSGTVELGGRTLTLTGAADTFDGAIHGTGGLTVAGGTETLTAASTYTGATTIAGGASLVLSGSGSIANSTNVAANGTFDISATTSGTSVQSLSGSGHVVLGGETLTLTNGSGTFSGDISGSGGLVMTGGTQTLSGANSYTGGTSISGGTLRLTGAGTLGDPTGSLSLLGGVLDLGGTTQTVGTLSLSGGRIVGGGRLNASAYSIAGGQIDVDLGGSANLTLTGSGVTTLTRANSYTGLTGISSGASLALSGDGSIAESSGVVDNGVFDISATNSGAQITRLSGAGAVALGARTLVLTEANGSFTGVIAGSGGLTVRGGTQTLEGANSFTGAATVEAGGGLKLVRRGGVSGASGVVADGTFDISGASADAAVTSLSGSGHVALGDRSLVLTQASGDFAGDIAGAGGLVVTGGTETLGGANSFTGGTRVTGGATLAARSDAALGGSAGGVSLDGGVLLAAGDLATARTIQVLSGGGAIRAGGGTVSLDGQVILGGDLSTGGGKVSLTGLIQGRGALTVSDGMFHDNGTIAAGSVTVAQAATLRGVGTINAPTTVAGTLAPGASPGTLTFNAPVTLLAGSTSQFDIDGTGTGAGAGSYSRVIVNGAGNGFTAGGVLAPRLRGLTGSAGNAYAPPIGQQFRIISAAGGVAGSFSSLTQPDGLAAGARFDALYAPTTLSLVVTPVSYADLGTVGLVLTANQKAVGAALDADRSAAGLRLSTEKAAIYDPLYALSAGQIPAALNGLSPEVHAGALMAARQAWQEGASAVGDQLADRRVGLGAAGPGEVTLWGAVFGQSGDVGPSATGYSTTVGGLVTGVDRTLENGAVIGLALGLADARAELAGGARAQGDLVQAMAYGGLRRGRMFVDWQADYLRTDQDLTRPGGPLRTRVAGDGTLQGAGLQVSAGWDMTLRQWRVEPTLGLGVLGLWSEATQEAPGGALAEDVAGLNNTSVQSFAGVRLARMVSLTPDLSLQVRGLLGWSHEMADDRGEARASLAGIAGAPFTVTTAAGGRDAAKLGFSFNTQLTPRVTLFGAYAADIARERDSQNLMTGLRARW